MIYLAENYKFIYNQKYSFKKLVLITAKKIASLCDYFEAEQLIPKKDIKTRKRIGELPKNIHDKERFIEQLLGWIFSISEYNDNTTFHLVLSNKLQNGKQEYKFGYWHGMSDWTLDLSKKEFFELQQTLKRNNLPTDIFFPSNQTICVIPGGQHWKSKLKRFLGWQYCFSPKQWEQMKKEGKDKNFIIQKIK